MCGLFALFTSTPDATLCPRSACRLAAAQVTRGHHAWGIAWLDSIGTIRSYRAIGPVTDSLEIIADVASTATAMIGHTRWATHGAAEDLACAHPFTCAGGFLAHNGIIPSHERLAREHGLLCTSECDSEVLARLVESHAANGAAGAFRASINAVAHGAPLATIALFGGTDPRIVYARRGNPLARTTMQHGKATLTLIGSNVAAAPSIDDDTVTVRHLFRRGAPTTVTLDRTAPTMRNVKGSTLFA